MSDQRFRLRHLVPAIAAIGLLIGLFVNAELPAASAGVVKQIASQYKFTNMPIAMPPGYHPTGTIRQVNPAYQQVQAWISSVGAGIAMTDVTGHGRADGMCIVDTRTNDVVVTYTPTAPAADRFTPFVLNAAPLPMDSNMAPMGCVPGDFNGDGRTDFIVYYWGRSPIVFLARSTATTPSASAYRPQELLPNTDIGGQYYGPDWNTNAMTVADFDGTGHPDLFIGNYFPDSAVLNPKGINNVWMPDTLSDAKNGGGDYIYKWTGGTSGPNPTVSYQLVPNALPHSDATGWTLGAAAADLTGSGLPDIYIANDFGPDHLMYNESTPGNIHFITAVGARGMTTPKSFDLGRDSFKGMGIDFGDLASNGRFDMMVSNITSAWGLEESNFVFMNQATSNKQMQQDLAHGFAPFDQDAQQMGMAFTGWAWDLKMGDFLDSGTLDVVQSDGFVLGSIDRWNWLQEMAMGNDDLLANPAQWPLVQAGDDLSGHECVAFYGHTPNSGYVNLSKKLGLCDPIPTRGVSTSDTRGNGRLDFALARQWGPPAFYANQATDLGHYLGLNLYRPAAGGGTAGQGLEGAGTPAYGTTVQISYPGHTQISQLDGGNGSGGRRSFEVNFGLGSYNGPVTVTMHWRDASGQLQNQVMTITPGTHNLMLGGSGFQEMS